MSHFPAKSQFKGQQQTWFFEVFFKAFSLPSLQVTVVEYVLKVLVSGQNRMRTKSHADKIACGQNRMRTKSHQN
jgi:hypothetical protein